MFKCKDGELFSLVDIFKLDGNIWDFKESVITLANKVQETNKKKVSKIPAFIILTLPPIDRRGPTKHFEVNPAKALYRKRQFFVISHKKRRHYSSKNMD